MIPERFVKIWPQFAKGENATTLIDDLSFSYYYHSQGLNQVLHLISLLSIYASIAILTASVWPCASTLHINFLGVLLLLPYSTIMLFMEWVSGLFYAIWFLLWILVSAPISEGQSFTAVFVPSLLVIIFMPLLQLIGHFFYERRLPGFKVFEALFTTPCFLMLRVFTCMGYYSELYTEIVVRSAQWSSLN
jgi:uncharacterized membrane protein YGL010W